MEYKVGNKFFVLSYSDLREQYHELIELSDAEFLADLPKMLHFACVVSYLKELGNEATISDLGIIHQLVHLQTESINVKDSLPEIRQQFKTLLKLD